jgi:hypothetical protein
MTPDPLVFFQFALISVSSIAALSGIGIVLHAYMQSAKRKSLGTPRAAVEDDRLQRLEQAVDSIAIEVERISEGQRFLTRLQSGQVEERARD